MNQASWLPNLITEDKDEDLVQLVLHSLNHDKKMIRAFAVALLENNADEEMARRVNDILIVGYTDPLWDADLRHNYRLKDIEDEDKPLDPDGLP